MKIKDWMTDKEVKALITIRVDAALIMAGMPPEWTEK